MIYLLGPVALDTFPFSFDKFGTSSGASVVSKGVIGGYQPKEFTGEEDTDITISGQILPMKFGGLTELEMLKKMMKTGTPFPVHRADGTRLGWFALTKINEDHEHIMPNGIGYVVKYDLTLVKTKPDAGAGQQLIQAFMSLFGR